jgi:ABC-2 type transport system permease protein
MNKIVVILQKEWLELRQQRGLLLGVILPPLLLTILPLATAYGLGHISPGQSLRGQLPPGINNPAFIGLTQPEAGQVIIGQQFSILLLLLPMIIPSVIAAYSIVGEKTNRTLEPLLATPVRTWDLLLGKSLASLIPAIGVTWICGTLFAIGMAAVAINARVFATVVTPGWLLVMVLCTPLLAVIAVAAMVAISSRVNDPRTAQQLSGVAVVPILLVFFGQITGWLVLRPALVLGAVVVLGLLAAFAIWGATRLFQREVILTRWK